MSKRILVAGVGGVLGRELVDAFLAHGIQPAGLELSERGFSGLDGKLSAKVVADVTKPGTLKGALASVGTVVSVIGITRVRGKVTHMDVDYQGNVNLLAEAERAGVHKFVFISPAGTDLGARQGVPLMEAKFKFEEKLKRSGVEWVIVRSGGFMRDLAEMAKLARKGRIYIIGHGKAISTPIEVSELASLMVKDTLTVSNAYTSVGGPQDMAWDEICEACFRVWGKPTKLFSVPVWPCHSTLAIIRPFSFQHYALGKLFLFFSINSVPTEKRGKTNFSAYLEQYYDKKG